jgi:hypothetical protein
MPNSVQTEVVITVYVGTGGMTFVPSNPKVSKGGNVTWNIIRQSPGGSGTAQLTFPNPPVFGTLTGPFPTSQGWDFEGGDALNSGPLNYSLSVWLDDTSPPIIASSILIVY